MKRFAILAVLIALTISMAAQRGDTATRMLTGLVMDQGDAPLGSAVVYLKNMKTLSVKTFITDNSGSYRFPALSPNVDYQIYAEREGKRSDTKMLSSLDSRANPVINLRITAK